MSPRKRNVIVVEDWPKPKIGRPYKGKVLKATIARKSKYLNVEIENLEPEQAGRIHEIELSLPTRPGSRTSSFFLACGIDTDTVGVKICLDDVIGVTLLMRFASATNDDIQDITFERIDDSSPKEDATAVEEYPGEKQRW